MSALRDVIEQAINLTNMCDSGLSDYPPSSPSIPIRRKRSEEMQAALVEESTHKVSQEHYNMATWNMFHLIQNYRKEHRIDVQYDLKSVQGESRAREDSMSFPSMDNSNNMDPEKDTEQGIFDMDL